MSITNHTIDSYFKKEIYELPYGNLNPSMSFVFFLQCAEDFSAFWEAIKRSDIETFYSVIEKDIDINFDDVIVIL